MDSIDSTTTPSPGTPPASVGRWRRWAPAGGLLAGGLVAGALLAGTLTANAQELSAGTAGASVSAQATPGAEEGTTDESRSRHAGEEALTGETADKVRAAALAEYPGATVLRVESDSDGVYEAHLETADGERLTVEVDANFTVTGTEAHPAGGRGGHHGRGGHGPCDEDGTSDSGDGAESGTTPEGSSASPPASPAA